ncbi:DUF1045 domain-containing protein [Algicella marina]|uniref:DUF1045 domain-containing protein n=1 Tax=Algicella marina TaxID=2683284 RepID=A0A6P1T853_9RHOB|nr:DUF1045 domain-containing protein [Algicella marina]QHQ36782.1 DUF1045 domain-containing protein [Algicella marina]
MHTRYAIYYTPSGRLADFGASWLGWDVRTGTAVAHPPLDLPLAEMTATPRKYGLHATLKPPFRLAPGETMDTLASHLETACKAMAPAGTEGLALTRLGGFLALTPTGDTTALDALAAEIVRRFDGFRAPSTEAELARRRQAKLTAEQDRNLTLWGYPYVMESFRFHITLSRRLTQAEAEQVEPVLRDAITPLLPTPFFLDHLTLAGERPDGMFEELARLPLAG